MFLRWADSASCQSPPGVPPRARQASTENISDSLGARILIAELRLANYKETASGIEEAPSFASLPRGEGRTSTTAPSMEILHRPPEWLNDLLPEAARDILANGGWNAVVGVVGLVALWFVWKLLGGLLGPLFRRSRKSTPRPKDELQVDLTNLPLPAGKPGLRRLTADGVPVRMRLVVVAAAGKEMQINAAAVDKILDRVLPGLGGVANQDRPAIRIWPPQLSY